MPSLVGSEMCIRDRSTRAPSGSRARTIASATSDVMRSCSCGRAATWRTTRASLDRPVTVSYTHLRAHETRHDLVCRLLLEKKKKEDKKTNTKLKIKQTIYTTINKCQER